MISLRRHVLTLVAVFLALAIGVVLGSTSVATSIRDAVVDSEQTTAAQLDGAQRDLRDRDRAVDRLDGMAGALARGVTDGVLEKRPVLIVVAPGATGDDVTSAVEAIDRAGGVGAGRLTLTDKAVDPAADAEIQALVANLPIGKAPAADADLGTQIGTAIGRAGLLRTEDAEPHLEDEDRATVLTTLADAGVISYDSGTLRPGQLVLVVTGPDPDEAVGTRLASFTRTLDSEGAGAVLSTHTDGNEVGDAVSALRESGETGVSTSHRCCTSPRKPFHQ